MIREFEDLDGKKHHCASELNVKGKKYYITFNEKAYIQNEDGKFIECTEIPEELKTCLEEPESLDVIMPENTEDTDVIEDLEK